MFLVLICSFLDLTICFFPAYECTSEFPCGSIKSSWNELARIDLENVRCGAQPSAPTPLTLPPPPPPPPLLWRKKVNHQSCGMPYSVVSVSTDTTALLWNAFSCCQCVNRHYSLSTDTTALLWNALLCCQCVNRHYSFACQQTLQLCCGMPYSCCQCVNRHYSFARP